MNRREFLRASAAAAALGLTRPRLLAGPPADGVLVNDIHSQLNPTRVHEIVCPRTVEELQEQVHDAARGDRAISIAAGRHAMGGQQFGEQTTLVDMRGLNRIVEFDAEKGEVEVEAGVEWPRLIDNLLAEQRDRREQWGIIQKQTGADRLSLGGALAANIHGRGLTLKPIIQDVAAFTLIGADGEARTCSRAENPELFRLAIGGYGLFGVIARVRLKLMRRRKLERVVEVQQCAGVMDAFAQRISDGYLYGDFQFSVAAGHEEYLRQGVFSCYRPVADDTPMPEGGRELGEDDWRRLYLLGHTNRKQGFDEYTRYYLSTSGQLYWSDLHQLSAYVDGYHRRVDEQIRAKTPGSEMITEIYVPRPALPALLDAARRDFAQHGVNLIYGTVRLIERDAESFLAWAREPWACVIFNLHVDHDPAGIERAAADFRRLIDRGIELGGSYYLTYHRWASRSQVETCHPRFAEFLRLKRSHDPAEVFQSDWYRHYRDMLGGRS